MDNTENKNGNYKDIPQSILTRLALCPFCDEEGRVTPLDPNTLQVTCTACGSVGGIDVDSKGTLYMYWRKKEKKAEHD